LRELHKQVFLKGVLTERGTNSLAQTKRFICKGKQHVIGPSNIIIKGQTFCGAGWKGGAIIHSDEAINEGEKSKGKEWIPNKTVEETGTRKEKNRP